MILKKSTLDELYPQSPIGTTFTHQNDILHSNSPKSFLPTPKSSLRQQYLWLGLYFFFNLSLTIFNKIVLGKFPYPYTLTAIHTLAGSIGCSILLKLNYFTLSKHKFTFSEQITLLFFSFLYTINIAISNVSLELVTVPFHQVIRATTPLFVILLNLMFFGTTSYSLQTYFSLILIVLGVGFATYGDYYSTTAGFMLTLLGAALAALKTVLTNRMQTGKLNLLPLELLYRMSPLAFIQTLSYAYITGELKSLKFGSPEADIGDLTTRAPIYPTTYINKTLAYHLVLNGVIAFGLNIVSFTANKKTNALTMTVAANVKQVITILLAIVFFSVNVNFTNSVGIILTLIGGGWYAKVELDRKNKTKTGNGSSQTTYELPYLREDIIEKQGVKTSIIHTANWSNNYSYGAQTIEQPVIDSSKLQVRTKHENESDDNLTMLRSTSMLSSRSFQEYVEEGENGQTDANRNGFRMKTQRSSQSSTSVSLLPSPVATGH